METKCRKNKIEKLKKRLQLEHSFVVDCRGLNVGNAFLQKDDVDAKLESYTPNHISLRVKNVSDENNQILTGFYGSPSTIKRQECWQLLRGLKPTSDLGWDFNEILSNSQKYGEALIPYRQMENFKMAVDDCRLSDLGWMGNIFTWSNNKYGDGFTK